MTFKLRTWTNYKPEEDTKKYGHNFDHKKIMLKKAGETYNVYDRIQAANVDVDIYETLAKYNMLPTRENAAQMLSNRGQAIYADMRLFEGEHPQEFIDRANNLWETLPLEVRQEFGNDRRRFTREGEDWLKNKLKGFVEKNYQEQKANEVKNNEEKGAQNE